MIEARSGCWNLRFLMDLHDWELEGVNELMDLPYSKQVIERNEDCLHWNLDRKGRFSVKFYYACLRCGPTFMFPWKGVWGSRVPRKVALFFFFLYFCFVFFFFFWFCFGTATMNSIPTVDNPVNWRLVLVNRCVMC